jgi:hypothetical protein
VLAHLTVGAFCLQGGNNMQHSFDVRIAKEYGINAAVLLNNMYFWIEKNRANNTNLYDGNYWTYNSKKAFAELFPYLNERQIDYALKKLIDGGIIITGNYNKLAYDRTLWYAITKKGYSILQNCKMEDTNLLDGTNENVQPIPDIKPAIKTTDVNTDTEEATERNKVELLSYEEIAFKEFWEAYPKKVNKKGCYKSFCKIKNLKAEMPLIMEALERFKASKGWLKDNGQFIPHPTTWINQERWKDEQAVTREDQLKTIDMDGWL